MIETQEQKCERCLADGLKQNEDCPYYGEPNGCNSPTYGEYPLPKNNAKMREALKYAYDTWVKMYKYIEPLAQPHLMQVLADAGKKMESALAAPARNCDRFASAEEAWDAYDEWVASYRAKGETEPLNEFGWLFAEAKKGATDGNE